MTNEELHQKLRSIRHGWSFERLWREYDLTYWQMLCALGFPIPSRIEARWPYQMNAGNPYKCGICEAKNARPWLFYTHDAASAAAAERMRQDAGEVA